MTLHVMAALMYFDSLLVSCGYSLLEALKNTGIEILPINRSAFNPVEGD